MPEIIPINYLEFTSVDRGASQRFFEAAFGWTFTPYGPDYCSFDNAGLDGGIAQAGTDGLAVPPLVVLYAEDIDAAQMAVERAGGVVTQPQFDFPGGRRFHFREPGGNELAVWSALKETLV